MEFKLSKIQETLEKSRKVLMESMEIRPTTVKSSFMDRFNYPRFGNIKKPEQRSETDHSIFKKLPENDKSNFSYSPTPPPYEFSLMDPQKLEIERQKIHLENEILMKKLQNPQGRYFGQEKSSNASRNMTPTPLKYKEMDEERYSRKHHENSLDHLKYLKEKVEADHLKENTGVEDREKERRKNSVKNYKKLVDTLEKKLRVVTKKYEDLKKGENSGLIRNSSTVRTKKTKKQKKGTGGKVKRDRSCVSHRN